MTTPLLETLKDFGSLLTIVVPAVGAGCGIVWRHFAEKQRRQEQREDDDRKRILKERDDAQGEAREMTARWIREVQLGAERALQPAPRGGIPESLPPPKFKEPVPIQEIRQNVETKTLRRLRIGAPDPNSDDTIRDFDVEAAIAPVKPEPVQPQPYRARQISVVEVDARKKR